MNAKGDLIARVLALGLGVPTFEAETSGPAHDRTFHATVLVGGHPLGSGGEGRSKKEAERVAAESALHALEGRPSSGLRESAARWPIYSAVLAEALDAAVELSSDDATLDDIRADAARLYRDLLSDLGHGPEPEDA